MILFLTVLSLGMPRGFPTPAVEEVIQVKVPAVLSNGGKYDAKLTKENCDKIAEAYIAGVTPQLSVYAKIVPVCVPDSQFERDQQAKTPS
ncbi:hypothetical protein D3C87_1631580 [compost metagenome]